MCTICRKFKKGSLTVEEAREELEEQAEYLTEEHIEDIEELLSSEEDAYDYISQRSGKSYTEVDEEEAYYDEDEEPLPEGSEKYLIEEED